MDSSLPKLVGCEGSLLREKKYTYHSGGEFDQYLRIVSCEFFRRENVI